MDAGTINIGTSGVEASDTSDINIGTSNSARTITVGNDTDTTGTTKVDVNAIDVEIDVGTGGFTVDSKGAIDITTSTGNTGITIDPHGSGTLTLGSDDNTKVDVNALTIELDAASKIIANAASTAADAVSIVSAGGIDVDAENGIDINAVDGDVVITANGSDNKVVIKGDHTAGTAVHIDANDNAASEVQIDAGVLDIDVTGATTIDGVGIALNAGSGELNLTTTGTLDVNANVLAMNLTDSSTITITSGEAAEDLTIEQVGANDSSIIVQAAGTGTDAIKLNASAGSIDIDSNDNITIDAADDISLTTTSGDGLITLHSAHTAGQAILIDANAAAGSILDIDAGILDVDVQGTATVTAGTSISLDSTGAILTRDTGIHFGPSGVGAGMAALTAGNSPMRIFKAVGNLYPADMNNQGEAAFPFNGDGSNSAPSSADVLATAGDLVISNRRTVDASGKATGKIVVDGAFDIQTLNVSDNLVVAGNLTVNGTATTLNTTSLEVEDPLIFLAKNQSGAASLDAGLIIERGDNVNAGMLWDESANRFSAITTNDTGGTAGNVGITGYVPISAQTFMLENPNNKIDLDTDIVVTSAADVTFTAGGGNVTPTANNGAALGSGAKSWSNLFIGVGGTLNFKNSDVTLTHVDTTGLLLNSTKQLQFGDAATHIKQVADGQLEMEADVSIQLDSPIIDFEDDGVILQFGDDDDVTLTHIHNSGLQLNSARRLFFRNTNIKINSSADNTLDLTSSGDINLTATNDVNLPASVGLTFGADTNKIEVDGANDMTVITANDMTFQTGGADADKFLFRNGGSTTEETRLCIGDTSTYIERQGGSNNIRFVSDRPIQLDCGGTLTLDGNSGVNIKHGDSAALSVTRDTHTILLANHANDIIFKTNPGSATEIARFDTDQSSLLMAGQKKIQFNDANKYIHYDGTNLTLVSNSDIKLDPDGNDVTIVDIAAQLNFNSNSYSIRLDGDVLKFKDSENNGEVTLTQLATIGPDSGGGIEYAGTSPDGRARSDYTFLLDYGQTLTNYIDHGTNATSGIKDRATDNGDSATSFAGEDLSFYVNSQDATRKIAGFAVDMVASGSLSFVDRHDAESNGVIYQSQDLTYFKSRVGAGSALTTNMYLKPGGAGVAGIYLGENRSLFFSNSSNDTTVNIQRVLHTVEGAGGQKCMQHQGHILPQDDNIFNLGTADRRFANLYTGDLHLNNMGSNNDVDGTAGNWTIQEGEDNLYVINNLTGKKFKMMLQPLGDEE